MAEPETQSGPPPPPEPTPERRSRVFLMALAAAEAGKWRGSRIQDGLVAALGAWVLGLSAVRLLNDDLHLSPAFSGWAQSTLLLGVYVVARCWDIWMSAKALGELEGSFAKIQNGGGDEKRLRELAASIVPACEAIAAKRSATLCGAAGGVSALIAGEALAQLAPAMGTQPPRLALTILGILAAHLLWRWRRRVEWERRDDSERARRDALVARIGEVRKLLAGERKSAPSSPVIEEHERQHLELIRELGEAPLAGG